MTLPPGEAKNSEAFSKNHSKNHSIARVSGRQVGTPCDWRRAMKKGLSQNDLQKS